MSPEPHIESSSSRSSSERRITGEQRLKSIRRALQRRVRRKLKGHERAALEHCALLGIRYEIAARDVGTTSDHVVRLFNAYRRSELHFLSICGVSDTPKPKHRDMTDVEQELRAHAG